MAAAAGGGMGADDETDAVSGVPLSSGCASKPLPEAGIVKDAASSLKDQFGTALPGLNGTRQRGHSDTANDAMHGAQKLWPHVGKSSASLIGASRQTVHAMGIFTESLEVFSAAAMCDKT